MKIDVAPTPKTIVNLIEEYCESQRETCPNGCFFDKAGICTENHAFNTYLDKYECYMKNNRGAS